MEALRTVLVELEQRYDDAFIKRTMVKQLKRIGVNASDYFVEQVMLILRKDARRIAS